MLVPLFEKLLTQYVPSVFMHKEGPCPMAPGYQIVELYFDVILTWNI
jgi:hypothetical protein